ncbi:MAG TPA: DUF4258 domain-containing protein [Vicinamibacterales bacterium]
MSAHLLKRMEDRAFSEVDLRRMMEYASGHREDVLEGRFVVDASHSGWLWEIIVEPDEVRQLLVVITAYPVDRAAP